MPEVVPYCPTLKYGMIYVCGFKGDSPCALDARNISFDAMINLLVPDYKAAVGEK